MGGHDNGAAGLGLGQQVAVEHVGVVGVQADVGLVEEQKVGAGCEADDDGDHGPLAAGELFVAGFQGLVHGEIGGQFAGKLLVPGAVAQAGALDHVRAGPRARIRGVNAGQARVVHDKRVVEGALAEDLDGAGGGLELAGDDPQQRGLAHAVAAKQAMDAGAQIQVDTGEHLLGAEAAGEVAGVDGHWYMPLLSATRSIRSWRSERE